MKKSSHSKYLGLLIIASSLVSLFILYRTELPNQVKNPIKVTRINTKRKKSKLQALWEEDIKKMKKENLFHKEISSLKKVRVFLLDENLHKHFKGLKTPFKYNNKGRNLLEVSFMTHFSENENKDKLIVQYNLTDKGSKNMFWEFSRTINLDDDFLN